MTQAGSGEQPSFFGSTAGWIFCAFLLVAAFLLIAEHRAHLGYVLPYVPLVLIGLCVVLHAYMHGRFGPRSNETEPPRDAGRHGRSHL